MKPGKYNMTMQAYLEAPGESKHSLDNLRKCPAYYMDVQMGRVAEQKKTHHTIGTALHELFFERKRNWLVRPDTYIASDGKEKPWTMASKSCKAWMRDHGNKPILTKPEERWLEETVETMRLNPHVKQLPLSGEFEQSLFAYDDRTGLLIKTRPDWIAPNGVFIDLKSTTDASTDKFSKDLNAYGYHIQAAMARKVARLLGMEFNSYFYIIVEKSDPCRINVRQLQYTAIDLGAFIIDDLLELLVKCKESGYWPDYSGEDKRIGMVDVPVWAYTQQTILDDEPLKIGGKEVRI